MIEYVLMIMLMLISINRSSFLMMNKLSSSINRSSFLMMKSNNKEFGKNANNKGFGSTTSKEARKDNKSFLNELERNIQDKIDSNNGLREVLNLSEEIDDFNKAYSLMNTLDQTLVTKEKIESMQERSQILQDLRDKYSLSKQSVLEMLLQITFDESAQFRFDRHETKKISKETNDFMLLLAKLIVDKRGSTLDVGCGDGILLRFLKLVAESNEIEERVTGIDLSKEMIKIAKQSYPRSRFIQTSFLTYSPDEAYSTIVMNEVLHNFLSVEETLKYASTLLTSDGQIIISHPRGFANMVSQYSKNRNLVPTILPKTDDEWVKICQNVCLRIKKFHSVEPYLIVLERV